MNRPQVQVCRVGLGSCCICRGEHAVRNIFMLERRAPMPGRGWGCMQCGLAQNGAVAVVCDHCLEMHPDDATSPLVDACRGYPVSDGRVPIGELSGIHRHDMAKHPGEV